MIDGAGWKEKAVCIQARIEESRDFRSGRGVGRKKCSGEREGMKAASIHKKEKLQGQSVDAPRDVETGMRSLRSVTGWRDNALDGQRWQDPLADLAAISWPDERCPSSF